MKNTNVQILDRTVTTRQSFESWLRTLLGEGASLVWEMNDCGEGGDRPLEQSVPFCVEVIAKLDMDRELTVSIAVGNSEVGVSGTPTLVWALLTVRGHVAVDTRTLSQLAAAVRR